MTEAQSTAQAERPAKLVIQPRTKRPARPARPAPARTTPNLTKALPTDRVTFAKQLALLRAYAAASGPGGKVVANTEVAGIVKMSVSTVSISNAFFAQTGLLTRAEGGYLPAPDVVSFQRAYDWNPETASLKLAPIIAGTWFAKALMPKLAFEPMNENDALTTLADTASAGPAYRNQLRVCLDYMGAAGLIQRDGTLIRLSRMNGQGGEAGERSVTTPEAKEVPKIRAAVATGFMAQPTEGIVHFNVTVRVDMKEFEEWQPERIAAFFSGIAQVLAAKGNIEKDSAS